MNEQDLINALKRLGITVDVSPLATTLIYPGIYAQGETFETALARFLEKSLEELQNLRRWKEDTMPIVSDWSSQH